MINVATIYLIVPSATQARNYIENFRDVLRRPHGDITFDDFLNDYVSKALSAKAQYTAYHISETNNKILFTKNDNMDKKVIFDFRRYDENVVKIGVNVRRYYFSDDKTYFKWFEGEKAHEDGR